MPSTATYDAMLPLPDSIVAKIHKLEFVDMSELRPESWLLDEEADEKSVAALFKSRKKPVTDILIWVQCLESPMNIPTGIVGMTLRSLLLTGKSDAGGGLDDHWGYGLGVCASGWKRN